MRMSLSMVCGFGTALLGLTIVTACSGVNDYPASGTGGSPGDGGAQQQGQGGAQQQGQGGAQQQGQGGAQQQGQGGAQQQGQGGAQQQGQGGAQQGQGGAQQQGGAAQGGRVGSGGSGTGGAGTAGSGTAGSGTAGSSSVSFAQVQSIINKTCGVVGCHSSGGQSPNLSTSGATLLSTLTGTTVRQCANNKLVVANNTSTSALVLVTTNKCTGLQMPVGCTTSACLPAADAKTITDWITAGAKNP